MTIFNQAHQVVSEQYNIGDGRIIIDEPFVSFPKLYRLKGPVVVTEKIDGTNAQIYIGSNGEFKVGSRTRWITPDKDNFQFARWAYDNQADLVRVLGEGKHYGEWWGQGIQRGYGMKTKYFSLFNTTRWSDPETVALLGNFNIRVVPVLYTGPFNTAEFDRILAELKISGSRAAPGFMNPEGVVIYDTQSGTGFKKTFDYDDTGKGTARDEHGNVI